MKPVYAILLLFGLFSSCQKETDCCVFPQTKLLPLNTGNYWVLKEKNPGQSLEYEMRIEIGEKEQHSGNEYFRMIKQSGTPGDMTEEILFYRIGSDGFVYELLESGPEENVFRLQARVMDEWTYMSGRMKLLAIFQYEFANAEAVLADSRRFGFDIPSQNDEEYSIVLAPEIGFVSVTTMANELELSEARIADKMYTFR